MSTQQIILLVTTRPKALEAFAEALRVDGEVTLIFLESAREAVETAVRVVPAMAVIDQDVGGLAGLDVARRLLLVNAFIHTAILSDMDSEAFHELSEGLGVLAHLPMQPGAKDAGELLAKLRAAVR